MWTTLALMSALSLTPAQAGQLQLKNARFTYGLLGQERKESSYLPGDLVVLSFDIEGLKANAEGIIKYSMALQLFSHKKNKNLFEQEPQRMEEVNSLGGSRRPAIALTNIFHDMEPGKYTMKVAVTDLQGGNATQKLEHEFTVKPVEFGFVRVGFVYLPMNENQVGAAPFLAPPIAVPGQSLMLHFTAVGFSEAGNKSTPKLSVQMEIQDENGKAVGKPFGVKKPIEDYPDAETRKRKELPFQMPIQINRSGKFKIVLSATDEHNHKKLSFPPLDLTVVEVNK